MLRFQMLKVYQHFDALIGPESVDPVSGAIV
jgi:hypothetical protein